MSATDGENVEKVAKLLNDDRRYTCTEIAHELDGYKPWVCTFHSD